MSLTLVLGPANSAKAGEVLGAYQLAARRDALLVVPTSADATYYDRELAESGHVLGRALTFTRLFEEIARRAGIAGAPISGLQKQRLLRRVITSLTLPSLERSAVAPGFAHAAGRLIGELQQARVSAPRFAAGLRAWALDRAAEQQYTTDLSAVYLRYADQLTQLGRLDPEGFGWAAVEALGTQPYRWGSTAVFFYGFDDLTAIELDAVATLAGAVGVQVTVSLTYEAGREALAARATVVEELRGRAASIRTLPALDAWYEPSGRAALHHLERHLFEDVPPPFHADPDPVLSLLEAGGERAEAELVAAEVAAALRDGVQPHQLVVVCRSLQRSGAILERALDRAGVPVTSARRVALSHTSLGRSLLALLRCAFERSQSSADDLLRWLRAPGLADAQQLDGLEAKLRRTGIRDLASAQEQARSFGLPVAQIEELRRGADLSAALRGCVMWLLAAAHRAEAAVLDPAEEVNARAAGCVLDALGELDALEPGRRLGAAELRELLEEIEVPVHSPGTPDGLVQVAEPLSIRARRFRRVIVAGLCEGEFPSGQTSTADPLLGDHRRHELALSAGIALPQDQDPLARERYLLYACVSRATERVTFSYRSSDEDGNVVRASPFIEDLIALFGEEWFARRTRRLLGEFASVGPAPALPVGAPEVSTPGPQEETRVLGPAALEHVRHTRVVSGRALESFAACPVKWLIENQLRPEDLEPEPDPLAKGSFMHSVLEGVISRLGLPLTEASLPLADLMIDELLQSPPNELAAGRPPEVRAAILRGIEADLRRYLRYEAANSPGWTPLHTELRFGMSDQEGTVPALQLGDGQDAVMLRGVIDRIDLEPGSDRVLIRDYKSGAQHAEWQASHWLEDHQWQVALYMLAARKLLGLDPVAGFYQPLSGPELRPRGVFTDGAEVGGGTYPNDRRMQDELSTLLVEVEQQATELSVTLRRGELTPCPETCSGAGGGGCRYPGICWARR